MIAPLREPELETVRSRRRLRHLHVLLAATLLPERQTAVPGGRIAAWKAWLFAGWVATAMMAYAASMLGVW